MKTGMNIMPLVIFPYKYILTLHDKRYRFGKYATFIKILFYENRN